MRDGGVSLPVSTKVKDLKHDVSVFGAVLRNCQNERYKFVCFFFLEGQPF